MQGVAEPITSNEYAGVRAQGCQKMVIEKSRVVYELFQDVDEAQIATKNVDMVILKVFNFQSIMTVSGQAK